MSDIEELCRNIYTETGEFYNEMKPQMGNRALGFKILYGPPIVKPPVLFLGYQPGGSGEDDKREQADGSHERWPPMLEYAAATWTLATRMQGMFDPEKLKGCTGLNAIFFRAPDVRTWKETPRELRARIESFCLPRVIRVVEAMQPALIVCIGFETLNLFGPTQPDLKNQKGRIITKSGTIAGYPAIGTLHLSGAHISRADRSDVAVRVGLAK